MNDYYQQSMRALQLAGMSTSTQKNYTRAIRMLVDFFGKTPDEITEQELQDYFLHRKNVDQWSAATMRICYSGIKFFFINVLQRDWHTLNSRRTHAEQFRQGCPEADTDLFAHHKTRHHPHPSP